MSLAGGRPGGPPAAVPAVASRSLLEVRGLRVEFGRTRALDGLDLWVAAGEVAGLVGPNGCGKTTALRAVLGLVRPAAGAVEVAGRPAGTLEAKSACAWVPDEPAGLDELSADELAALLAALWRAGERARSRAVSLFDAFGLHERRALQLGSLSHGQRRLASLVAALALERPLLLVDEATAALDPEAVVVLRELLRGAAARGAGVLLATQDLHFAETACDRVTLLRRGAVVAQGSPVALRSRFGVPSLEDVFVRALGIDRRLEEVRRGLDAR